MLSNLEDLLLDAIDFHWHGYPELALDSWSPLDDESTVQMAKEYGMKGIVLKSHLWPTMDRARILNKTIEGITIYGSITLNQCSGGISPWVAEAACGLGAKVIWMPTWGAENGIKRGGAIELLRNAYGDIFNLKPEDGIRILEENGSLKENAKIILEIAQKYDIVVSTGHLSPEESLALARHARDLKFRKLVMGHPNNSSVGATIDHMKEMVKLKGIIEFCFLGAMPLRQRFHPEQIVEFIKELGPGNCILSTDAGFNWAPPAPEMLRMCLACFVELGVPREDLKIMVQDNPARLLNS